VDDELITIGRFARLSGLSVATLRHYDDVDLLAPADVDPASGYRRYRRDQVGAARLIRSLRWVDLPIDEIRQILAGTDAHELLARHRRRLEREQGHLAAKLRDVDRFLADRSVADRSLADLPSRSLRTGGPEHEGCIHDDNPGGADQDRGR